MKRILFVNPFGIGDTLFTLTAAEAVKKKFPDSEIGFLCNERTQALVRLCATVTYVHVFDRDRLRGIRKRSPLGYLAEYRKLLGEFSDKQYDAMIDLSLGREFSFLGFLARIPRRIGFDHRGRGFFLNEKEPFLSYEGAPVAESQMRLLTSFGIKPDKNAEPPIFNIPEDAQKEADQFLRDDSAQSAGPYVAAAPGGGKSWGKDAVYKQWEPEKFAAALNAGGFGDGAAALLVGDESEKGILEAVRGSLALPSRIVCGQRIEVVMALLKKAKLLLGNDGGLVHLAHALKVPTVAVFGPVDEIAYGPYGNHTPHQTVSEPVSCRPCYSRLHFPPCPHKRRCLSQLSVEKVLGAIKKIT